MPSPPGNARIPSPAYKYDMIPETAGERKTRVALGLGACLAGAGLRLFLPSPARPSQRQGLGRATTAIYYMM